MEKELIENARSNIYPFHMPGHKRRRMDQINPYDIDITEIEGFDNLHHAEGIIKLHRQRQQNYTKQIIHIF